MVNYINVVHALDTQPVWQEPGKEFTSVSMQAEIKTYEVPDDIYIERTNEYSYGTPSWIDGPKVWLKFRWKGNQFYKYLTAQEYDDIIHLDDATMGAYYLIEPFIEMLKEDHEEVLYHFVRQVAKIGHDFDVKRLMWLVKNDGQDMVWSDDGKAMGGYVNNSSDWEIINDPYGEEKYYVNKDALKLSIPDKLKYHSDYSLYHNKPATQASGIESEVSMKSKQLPGMDTIVEIPCGCPYVIDYTGLPRDPTAWRVVQHLNDRHRWSREKIADWLDELHDSGKINIEFDTPEGMKDE